MKNSDNILYLGRRQLNQTLTTATTVRMQPGNVDDEYSINKLLDCCILYYYAVAHKYVVMVCICIYIYIRFSLKSDNNQFPLDK